MLRDPHGRHIIVGVVTCREVRRDIDTDDETPIGRIIGLEIIAPEDVEAARALMQRAVSARTDEPTLPLDMQDAISALLDPASPIPGELPVHGGPDPDDAPTYTDPDPDLDDADSPTDDDLDDDGRPWPGDEIPRIGPVDFSGE